MVESDVKIWKAIALLGAVFSALSAAPAVADVVVVSETRTMSPPQYYEHFSFNLPAPGIYDVQVTSEETLDLSAFWRWTEVTQVTIDPPHPAAGLLVWQDLDNRTGGYVTARTRSYLFSFEIHQPIISPFTYCPIVCPPELSDAPSTATFSATNPYLEFFTFGEADPEPLTDPFQYTVVITRRGSTVPEPSTWALMILGFGATGSVARRRRRDCIAA